ncbi:MAG: hypothetical protein ABIP97_13930 [Chthoniobacterales bacterium]
MEIKETNYTIRLVDPDRDYALFKEWWPAHGHAGVDRAILPQLGVMVQLGEEPMGALWLYMDNSVGVCFAEHPVTRPGLSLGQAREVFRLAIDYLKLAAKEMDYGFMVVRTPPAIARILEGMGFIRDQENMVSMLGMTGDSHGR